MKNLQKGFIVPLLIAIIAVLVIGGGVYAYTKYQPTQSVINTEATSTDQEAGWKTYTNTKYNFEFKYPANYLSKEQSIVDNVNNIPLSLQLVEDVNNTHLFNFACDKNRIVIEVTPQERRTYMPQENHAYVDPQTKTVIDKQLVSVYRTQGGTTALGCDGKIQLSTKSTWLKKNGLYYIISVAQDDKNLDSVFNNVISTFKFTSQAIQPSITVLSPNGGESFKQGDAMTIQWKANIQGSHVVNIILQRTDETQTTNIAHNVLDNVSPETGTSKYTWIIPSNLVGSFKARVSSPDAQGQDNVDNKLSDTSNSSFTINSLISLPTTCTDQQEGVPVITSLSSYSGPVGTTIEVRGCNFYGFESDLNVWVENSQGVKGIAYGNTGSAGKLMKVTLKPQLCQTDESYRGLPCASYLNLVPGVYKIYTIPWGKKSNVATFTVTSNAVVLPIPKEGDSRLDAKCLETYPNLPEKNWCYEIYRSGQWMRIN